ncbi:MAG: biotin--[acetyl-CoA-carboxylase] ligase [Dehalococcoidia bacterium]
MPPFDLEAYEAARSSDPTSGAVGALVRYRDRTASTMDDARAGAEAGDPCGTAYVGGEQSAGRGRQGRSWLSAASAGLYVTYLLCPPNPERAPLLSIAGGLAASDAIEAASGLRTVLKWPNDVLHAGPEGERKLCGILAESRIRGATFEAFLGIGINVRAAPLPPDLEAIATSIEAAGAPPPTTEALLAALSAALEQWAACAAADPTGLIDAWRARLVTLDRRVRLAAPGRTIEGEAIDVSPRGELILRLDDGTTEAFSAGDVTTAPTS